MTDDARFAGSAADGFCHRKDFQVVGGFGVLIKFAAFHSDCTGEIRVFQTGGGVNIFQRGQVVESFLSTAGFGNAEL